MYYLNKIKNTNILDKSKFRGTIRELRVCQMLICNIGGVNICCMLRMHVYNNV